MCSLHVFKKTLSIFFSVFLALAGALAFQPRCQFLHLQVQGWPKCDGDGGRPGRGWQVKHLETSRNALAFGFYQKNVVHFWTFWKKDRGKSHMKKLSCSIFCAKERGRKNGWTTWLTTWIHSFKCCLALSSSCQTQRISSKSSWQIWQDSRTVRSEG